MADQYIPKHKWVRTWPGAICPHTGELRQDFMTKVDGVQAGRIMLVHGGPDSGKWQWSGAYPRNFKVAIMPNMGFEETAREACRRAEAYWQAMLDQIAIRDEKAPPE